MKKITLVALTAALIAAPAYAGWWQTFGGANIDWGSCVQQTSDGDYIVTGFTYSFSTIPGKAEIWLIKLDSLGHTDWTKTYGEGGGFSVRQTSDGGYIIAGTKVIKTNSDGNIMWSHGYEFNSVQQTNDGGYILTGGGLKLMKLNANGDSVWAHVYVKGNYANAGAFVEQTSDGGYIIVGQIVIVDYEQGMQKRSIWLLKTDANGDTLWTRTYGGVNWDDIDRGHCVRQTSDGGYIIACLLDDPINRWDCLIKTDSVGNIEWKGIEDGELYCVEQTDDGGYIAAGGTESGTYTSSNAPLGGNLWLVKTDENGDTVWTRKYGGGETDAGRYVQQTADGGYIVVGYTTSFGAGDYDLYLLKTDSLGFLGVSEHPGLISVTNWQIVRALGSQVTLRYWDQPFGFKATVFDVTGRQVDAISSERSSGTLTWGHGFPSGVYFIKETTRLGASRTARVLIVH